MSAEKTFRDIKVGDVMYIIDGLYNYIDPKDPSGRTVVTSIKPRVIKYTVKDIIRDKDGQTNFVLDEQPKRGIKFPNDDKLDTFSYYTSYRKAVKTIAYNTYNIGNDLFDKFVTPDKAVFDKAYGTVGYFKDHDPAVIDDEHPMAKLSGK